MSTQHTVEHVVTVETRHRGNHGFPYYATCRTCGWTSRGYVARHAAQDMADFHVQDVVDRGLVRVGDFITRSR